MRNCIYKSPPPLTDPRDVEAERMLNIPYHIITVIKPFFLLALAAEYRSRRWVWSTFVRRPSEVYDTCRRTTLTAHETIGRFRNMVGAHQNLNDSCDLTTPLWGMVAIRNPWASTCYRKPTTCLYKIWSIQFHSLRRYERRYKMSKMGWFGVVRVTQGHWK